jgi:alpha-glucosidase
VQRAVANYTGKPLLVSLVVLLTGLAHSTRAESYRLRSPDGRIEVNIDTTDRVSYSVSVDGRLLLDKSTLSLNIDHQQLGLKPTVIALPEQSADRQIRPAVQQKFALIREHYNELRLQMDGGYAVVFRAFDEGVAYRFETSLPAAAAKVYTEEARFAFAGDYNVYYPKEESFFSHNERQFVRLALKEIAPETIASLPAVVETSDGTKIAICEADLEDYPGLWLRGDNSNSLVATFPPYPLEETLSRDRDYRVTRVADYLAITQGKRTYPWRLLGVARKDGDLIGNPLVYLLARPSEIADTSWIKPGKVAWDWWNANSIYGVDFKSGINTQTYKYYIDFAARYAIEYIILDEGWYKLGDLLTVAPDMDIAELSAYARQKNVGIILWTVWKTLDDQLEPALDQFQKWGIRGIKVDFMQRDDQKVMNFYAKVCREAAKRHMLVDFHGAIRPAIMTRTWPNLISTEGVQGLEHCKWAAVTDPQHDVTIPFTRMFMGPMDFTPGAMVNAARGSFAPIFSRPMSMGTRCHQLAMYVVYESPLQMLADSPSHYLREPEAMEFLSAVPSVWDDTRVLDAKLGEYVLVARRRGQHWYVGAMTNWTPRQLTVDLSFLPSGSFSLLAYQDGENANRFGSDYSRSRSQVSKTTRLTINLAPGGGWAARISPL